eukprot:1738513-Amphidinium_carterae.2
MQASHKDEFSPSAAQTGAVRSSSWKEARSACPVLSTPFLASGPQQVQGVEHQEVRAGRYYAGNAPCWHKGTSCLHLHEVANALLLSSSSAGKAGHSADCMAWGLNLDSGKTFMGCSITLSKVPISSASNWSLQRIHQATKDAGCCAQRHQSSSSSAGLRPPHALPKRVQL